MGQVLGEKMTAAITSLGDKLGEQLGEALGEQLGEALGDKLTEAIEKLGLDKIHRLMSSRKYSLRVDLEDFDGSTAYAEYRDFRISGPDDFYRLHVGEYRDSIDVAGVNQNNQQFTTWDQDHDPHSGNCARDYRHGAWWYTNCGYASLNGEYKADGARGYTGITWYYWKNDWRSYKHVEMKVKPWS
nr:hypothetical protein BaRGS_017384 [Batillaria attramentaria]